MPRTDPRWVGRENDSVYRRSSRGRRARRRREAAEDGPAEDSPPSVTDPVPANGPPAPVLADRLRELGPYQLCTSLAPLVRVAADDEAFRRAFAIAAFGRVEQIAQVSEVGSAAVDAGDGGEAELDGERVAASFAPEAAGPSVVNVESEEPVRQVVVLQGMARRAPLAEQDQIGLQLRGQCPAMPGKPTLELRELPAERLEQILAPVLRAQAAVRGQRDAEVGPVHLLLDDDIAFEQRRGVLLGE